MHTQTNINEKTIRACIKQDRRAQELVYQAFRVPMFGVCMRYSKDKAEAEDMLQEGFIRVFLNLKQYRAEGDLGAWIRRVMVTSALMYLRKNKKHRQEKIELSDIENTLTIDNEMLQNDRANAVIYLIRQLPEPHQSIFNMRVIDGFSNPEIAKELDMNEATVRSYFLRARKALQSMLNKSLTD